MDFNLIEGENVDLISPFPIKEIKRLIGWLHCYKSLMQFDGMPTNDEEWEKFLEWQLANSFHWGVIDKNNKLGYKHEAPLIGALWLDRAGLPGDIDFHFIGTRRAWGSGLLSEAAARLISYLFETNPGLNRLSGFILNKNKPAKAFFKRLGFKQDGLMKDYITQNGIPQAMAHFGITRKEQWDASVAAQTVNPLVQTSEQT